MQFEISRDEALHTEFAILLYSKLKKKIRKDKLTEIIREAVDIEKEFITSALPCRLIGMNATSMTMYIELIFYTSIFSERPFPTMTCFEFK